MASRNADIGRRQQPWSQQQSNNGEERTFSLMRHLVDEMEKSSQHTEEFARKQYGATDDENMYCRLYDDAWRSEESDATSLHEVPLEYLDNDRSDCEDTVNNAVTEVSSDFLSGKRANFGQNKYRDSDESHSDAEFKLITGMAYVARYPETAAGMSDNDWNPYGTESDTNISPRVPSYNGSGTKLSDSRIPSLTSFNPPLHSTDFNVNTPSGVMYSIPDSDTCMSNINEQSESVTAFLLEPDIVANFSSVSHVSEMSMNLNKPLLEPPVRHIDLNKTRRDSDIETAHAKPSSYVLDNAQQNERVNFRDLVLDQDHVEHWKYLGKAHIKRSSHSNIVVDYKLLQQDLQDIQDNLQRAQGPEIKLILNGQVNRAGNLSGEKTPVLSDSECDIIPSTTATPDRNDNKMAWDFAADVGYLQPSGLMGDISLETFTAHSHRPSDQKKSYNSDGDETRTSGSSDKIIDHAAADQALAEMSQILYPHISNDGSFQDADQTLFNFRNQREQIESRYQQLNNHGLAEKVYRILTNQDPQSQANGILSEVTAQERQARAQFAVNLHNKDFNYSAVSSHLDESSQSLALPDNVRKRLDLSGLSSREASRLADKSSIYVPVGKGFTVLDGMTKFLSSQVAKASERTFNHSLELIVPQQVVQCYPLSVENKLQERRDERPGGEETKRASEHPAESGASRSIETDRPGNASSVVELHPALNRPSNNSAHSHDDSDSSSGRRKEKYRPYRPAGSREVYYTESDVASAADSVTTIESTHIGSDDARGPVLPASAMGSRQDVPNVVGIYGNRKPLFSQEGEILPPIHEKSGLDERETESSQSYKGDKALENPWGKSNERSSSTTDKDHVEIQQSDGSIRSRHDNMVGSRQGSLREVTEESSTHNVVAARSTAGWADFRTQKERNSFDPQRSTENTDIEHSARIQEAERTNRNNEFHPVARQNDHERPSDHYRRPSDAFVNSEFSHQSRPPKESLSLRGEVTHDVGDSGRYKVGQRCGYTEDLNDIRERPYSARNIAASSSSRFYSEITDRPFRSRYDDAERPSSPRDLHSLPGQSYPGERHGILLRSHSDEDLHTSRDVHLSPAFHRALSPGLRQAIGRRSPILSRHIERSLRQPPAERSDHYHSSVQRHQSPPPTFLARERGQAPREYATSLRQSPSSATRRNQDRSWSPHLQPRLLSLSPSQEDFERPTQSVKPSESQKMIMGNVSPESDDTELDLKPVSKRAQLLTQALTQEKEPDIQPDIASLWEQFKANNDSYESSLNTSSLEAVTDLLLNPSPHLVTQCLKEREEHLIERQERAEADREKRRAEQRNRVRQSSSEEEVNVGYADLLAQKEAERMKRRAAKKKKGKSADAVSSKLEDSENIPENLFSIAEDASFEQSPSKSSSASRPQKSGVSRQAHIIDPNMRKLRERISKQKQKIDRHTLKELQKIEKLKRLEQLLSAKRKGEISDQTLEIQLDEISSTSTPGSENSHEGWGKHAESHNTTPLSDDSTTAKDSSTEMHARKVDKKMRIKGMKTIDVELRNKYGPIKTDKDRSSSPAQGVSQVISTKKSEVGSSEIKLLKLVKEGHLTAEEAYKLAVEREAAVEESSSLEVSHGSSSDEIYGGHSSRLHRLYSPYARDDSLHALKPRYVPKLKFAPSVYDVAGLTHSDSWPKHDSGQSLRNFSVVGDHNDSHTADTKTGVGYVRPKASQRAQPNRSFWERSAVSVPSFSRSAWQQDKKNHGSSPSGSVSWRTFSPGRREKRMSPGRLSPSRYAHRFSPTRECSSSPGYKENGAKHKSSNKKVTHLGSARYEKTGRSENKPPLRKNDKEDDIFIPELPENGGVAWHIPIDLQHTTWKLPTARASKVLPLQERKLVTNTLSKKTAEESLQIEDLEPLQGWQMDHKVWHKPDRPQGIPNELWEHIVHNDALASKANHWEVDPLMDRVQYILNKPSGDSGTEDDKTNLSEKPSSKLSLQEAFLTHKQGFISKCKERQKRLALASEHRKMQECLRLEREALFMDQERITQANLDAHPYSENLYQPRKRFFSKQEMKELTMKRYKKLPEVLQKQESDKRMEQCKLNRLRANIFNRKVLREALRKKPMRQR